MCGPPDVFQLVCLRAGEQLDRTVHGIVLKKLIRTLTTSEPSSQRAKEM